MTQETLFRYFKGEATPEEERQIGAWLLEEPGAQKEFEQAQFLFEASALYAPEKPVRKRTTFRVILRYTAGIAAAALLAVATGQQVRKQTEDRLSHEMMALSTRPGERAEVTLSDGTVVTLNADTRLEYPVTFRGDERRVRIDGEALFRVRHDEKHPFIVSTFASDIRVLGTTFNVLADEHSRLFETTLKEGQVRVTNLANLTDVHTMTPGEVVSLVDGRLQKSVLQDPASLCWVDGLVNLKADSFEALMARFEKVYGVHIILKASPSIEGLSGELRISEGIEHALKVLQHVVDFQYEHYEGNILIKQPK